ncbi:MAG: septum formation protein Maf [Anaerolineales bacterium]|nr:septum formation protein Maf [Anaerolineales bacterium]
MKLILASNSPRRKALLSLTGWPFEVLAADVDEDILPGEAPDDYVRRLAAEKALAVVVRVDPQATILAADTTVVDGAEILGKPVDCTQARQMLERLRGRTHQVYTALAIWHAGRLRVDCCATEVPMRAYSDVEMDAYIASGDPMDKAGAYAIQHPGFRPVEELQGCYANVVGLPLCHLVRNLRSLGLQPDVDITRQCQSALDYRCPVYETILRSNL